MTSQGESDRIRVIGLIRSCLVLSQRSCEANDTESLLVVIVHVYAETDYSTDYKFVGEFMQTGTQTHQPGHVSNAHVFCFHWLSSFGILSLLSLLRSSASSTCLTLVYGIIALVPTPLMTVHGCEG